jgi:uncharacterized protein YecE (DUF72 family)
MQTNVLVGTSGYKYQHWEGLFYPENLPSSDWLEFYSQYFNAIEITSTFQKQIPKKKFEDWYKRSPQNFSFCLKAPHFICQEKKFQDCHKELEDFFESAAALKEKLACVLWQFPGQLNFDLEILENFCGLLKPYSLCLHSFQFRNQSWFNNQTYAVLKNNNIGLCVDDSPDFYAEEVLTAPFIYFHFHGGKIADDSAQEKEKLDFWVNKTRKWLKSDLSILAFFTNDAHAASPKHAKTFLQEIIK